ncbi:Homer protein [Thalictrum thalictroides]|uniref:Homer protein n=1 Tax=Thalictrum thalictroides TaxID=46969 RepID=A0A7J6WTG7_THATH|nr:Homer protein [Thalictrum thalictroides]
MNPKFLLTTHFPITSSTIIKHFNTSSSSPRPLVMKCSSEDCDNGSLKNVLSGMVDKRVEELLNKQENKGLFDGLEKASLRVEMAKKELADIKTQEIEAAQMRKYVNYLETRESEIAECQREMSEARAMVDEAEHSLSLNNDGIGSEDGEIDKDRERVESAKAASVSAVVGTLAGLPISLSQVSSTEQLLLPLAITFITCALFGVTFRYTVRRDLDNIQLKTGTAAAFSVVKGLAALGAGPPLELNTTSFLSHSVDSVIYVSENLLVFVFAAVGLDYCFKMNLLSPFPVKTSITSRR